MTYLSLLAKVKIRDAGVDDMPAVTEIYNDAVLHTTAIWNDTKVSLDNRITWLTNRTKAGYPVLVAVDDADRVLGYASFDDWRAFEGYRFTVEHSVYVHRDARGQGIGEALMRALITRAQGLGKHVMVAGIEANNLGSIKLHQKLGFTDAGTVRQVGAKFGAWLDLTFLQLTLDGRERP